MSAVFVTAAGTEIGKTTICVALLEQLAREGEICAAYKPVVTGFDANETGSDTARLLAAQGMPLTSANIDLVSPWRFSAPLSPDVAARREHRDIDFDELVRYSRNAAAKGPTLIEGIGGVMVPLTDKHTVLDWISALELPTLLIVGSYLGALSHALTAASVLLGAGARLAGVVVNQSEQEPMATTETARAIERFLTDTPVDIVARAAPGEQPNVEAVGLRLRPYLDLGKKSPRRQER